MKQTICVREAASSDYQRVGKLICELLTEMYPELGYSRESLVATSKKLLKDGTGVWAFIAFGAHGYEVGVVTLNECAAIYAGGHFGEISELYVKPEHRSSGVGAMLIEAAADFGRSRGWSNIEVGSPHVPRWQKTVDFYLRCGFKEVGPRLDLKL